MIDPFDTFHEIIDARPKLLHKTPRAMCRWIGRITQQYGTVAGAHRDLLAEHEGLKRKLTVEMGLALNMEDIHKSLKAENARLRAHLEEL